MYGLLAAAITGLVKPEGGFDLIASTMGGLGLVLLAAFVYFGANDPSAKNDSQISINKLKRTDFVSRYSLS